MGKLLNASRYRLAPLICDDPSGSGIADYAGYPHSSVVPSGGIQKSMMYVSPSNSMRPLPLLRPEAKGSRRKNPERCPAAARCGRSAGIRERPDRPMRHALPDRRPSLWERRSGRARIRAGRPHSGDSSAARAARRRRRRPREIESSEHHVHPRRPTESPRSQCSGWRLCRRSAPRAWRFPRPLLTAPPHSPEALRRADRALPRSTERAPSVRL